MIDRWYYLDAGDVQGPFVIKQIIDVVALGRLHWRGKWRDWMVELVPNDYLRGALHEGVFVVACNPEDRDWIYLGEKEDGVDQNVSHTMGPKGPQSSIKRNEYLWRPKFQLEIWIAKAVQAKLPDETFVDVLLHAQEHGIGANRSQGMGKFDVLSCVEI